ncbi:hypothetical protein Ndes2437B_g06933 [Nannochloris sp. 'desiccata']|nr:hypothetical protein KSW81_005287 [Chlorella desiccata (nom. nud.)]
MPSKRSKAKAGHATGSNKENSNNNNKTKGGKRFNIERNKARGNKFAMQEPDEQDNVMLSTPAESPTRPVAAADSPHKTSRENSPKAKGAELVPTSPVAGFDCSNPYAALTSEDADSPLKSPAAAAAPREETKAISGGSAIMVTVDATTTTTNPTITVAPRPSEPVKEGVFWKALRAVGHVVASVAAVTSYNPFTSSSVADVAPGVETRLARFPSAVLSAVKVVRTAAATAARSLAKRGRSLKKAVASVGNVATKFIGYGLIAAGIAAVSLLLTTWALQDLYLLT